MFIGSRSSKEISNSETVRISNQLKINVSFTSEVGDVYEADVSISNDLSGLDSDEATTDKKFFLDEDYNYTIYYENRKRRQ